MTRDPETAKPSAEMNSTTAPVAERYDAPPDALQWEAHPVARRFALRTAAAAAVAALGAAYLGVRHSKPVEAAFGYFSDSLWLTTAAASSGGLAAVRGDSTGTAYGVFGYTTTAAAGTVGECNNNTGSYGVWGYSNTGFGVFGSGGGVAGVYGDGAPGVQGTSSNGDGVYGSSTQTNDEGVVGVCNVGVAAYGVWGQSSTGYGVVGSGGGHTGVWGAAEASFYGNGIIAGVLGTANTRSGVVGITTSTIGFAGVEGDGNTLGVQGVSTTTGSTTGYGVKGIATNGAGSAGVLGYAPNGVGYGFYGYSTSPGAAGALAYNTTTTGYGLQAYNGGAGSGYAARFGAGTPHTGNVLIEGVLTVLNGAPSTGARDASGALHRFYGVQSPDSWFEDFGSAQVNNGSATVQLDPTFAGVVDTDNYHVFLSPEGAFASLYVSNKSPGGFTVSDAGGGSSGAKPGAGGGNGAIGFSYRVVAKRKDVPAVRLEPIAEPAATPPPEIPQSAPAASPAMAQATGDKQPTAPPPPQPNTPPAPSSLGG